MSALSRDALTAVTWVFTGAGIVLTAGRYAIRLKTVKTFKADDYIHGVALIFLIGYVSAYTAMFPLDYSVEFWVAGLGQQPSDPDLNRYFHLQIAVSLLFWIVVYLIKFAFLFFYRFLFGVSKKFMRAWWAVSMFTVVTFLINFLSVFWACEAPRHLFVLEHCSSQRAFTINIKFIRMWCGLNVASSLGIILLPLWMLRGLQMRMSRKLGLAALFLIATTDVVFDITRTVYTVNEGPVALDVIWDILEPTIAVIVSSLPTYKALLGATKKEKNTFYQNLTHSGGATWDSKHGHNADEPNGVELSSKSTQVPREPWTNLSLGHSTEAVKTSDIV